MRLIPLFVLFLALIPGSAQAWLDTDTEINCPGVEEPIKITTETAPGLLALLGGVQSADEGTAAQICLTFLQIQLAMLREAPAGAIDSAVAARIAEADPRTLAALGDLVLKNRPHPGNALGAASTGRGARVINTGRSGGGSSHAALNRYRNMFGNR